MKRIKLDNYTDTDTIEDICISTTSKNTNKNTNNKNKKKSKEKTNKNNKTTKNNKTSKEKTTKTESTSRYPKRKKNNKKKNEKESPEERPEERPEESSSESSSSSESENEVEDFIMEDEMNGLFDEMEEYYDYNDPDCDDCDDCDYNDPDCDDPDYEDENGNQEDPNYYFLKFIREASKIADIIEKNNPYQKQKNISIKDFKRNTEIKECRTLDDLIRLFKTEDIEKTEKTEQTDSIINTNTSKKKKKTKKELEEEKRKKQNEEIQKLQKEQQQNFCKALEELNNMVGLVKLKEQLVGQLLFFMKDLKEDGMFLHTVIYGPPGTGKTTLINILAKIYKYAGILDTDKVVKAERSDLIAGYLGQTAIKTKGVLNSAKGGIFLLDEVYALGPSLEKNEDSFAKECVDTINQYLSEHVDELICIVCGYEKDVEQCFFNRNKGLLRRFQWRFDIDSYTPNELYGIMITQLGKGWILDVPKDYIIDKIKNNLSCFNGNGGSTRSLLDKCKMEYARTHFDRTDKILNIDDFNKGLAIYLSTNNKISTHDKLCTTCTERKIATEEEKNCTRCQEANSNMNTMYV